jgi:hypothetical protein
MPPGAAARGAIDAMAMYAGESTEIVTDVRSVASVVSELVSTAEELLARRG